MTVALRAAAPDDVPTILRFVRELAIYEREPDAVKATEADLQRVLFGDPRYAEAIIAEDSGAPLGFALFFHNFSTWEGKPGIYLEDLYVTPRRAGGGSAGRCWRASRRSPSSATALASNGRCSTGTRRRSPSTARSARSRWTNGRSTA